MRAPVLRVRGFVVSRIEREFLAVADGPQPVGRNAQRHQIGARGNRAAFAQCQIVLGACRVRRSGLRSSPSRWGTASARAAFSVSTACAAAVDLVAVVLEEHRLERRVAVEIVERRRRNGVGSAPARAARSSVRRPARAAPAAARRVAGGVGGGGGAGLATGGVLLPHAARSETPAREASEPPIESSSSAPAGR